MKQGMCCVRFFIFALFIGYSFGLELQSEETTLPKRLNAVVQLGKRLKLTVENVNYPGHRWAYNGTSVSEKCEVQKTAAGSSLICSDMDWSDEGLYEYQGVTRSGQRETLLAVLVKVVECIKPDNEDGESEKIVAGKSEKCFCSGITEKCEMADNLFRTKIAVALLGSYKVPSKWSSDGGSQPWKYYSLPEQLKGNLLMSYGGFLDIQTIDDEGDEYGPDVVLLGNELTLVYHYKRELEASGELSRKRIPMTEQGWRHLDGSYVSKNSYMTALSNVKEFYVKSSPSKDLEPLQVVLDSAGVEDRGMAKVTTVEKCECRVGYTGLSCERCAPNYYRRDAIGLQGVCVSYKEMWDSLKLSVGKRQYERYRNLYGP